MCSVVQCAGEGDAGGEGHRAGADSQPGGGCADEQGPNPGLCRLCLLHLRPHRGWPGLAHLPLLVRSTSCLLQQLFPFLLQQINCYCQLMVDNITRVLADCEAEMCLLQVCGWQQWVVSSRVAAGGAQPLPVCTSVRHRRAGDRMPLRLGLGNSHRSHGGHWRCSLTWYPHQGNCTPCQQETYFCTQRHSSCMQSYQIMKVDRCL